MPLYEYRCEACAVSFEELVRSQSEQVQCPKCGTGEVERQMSTFARGGRADGGGGESFGGGGGGGSGCGGCSGGNCSSCH